ncbi:unnamed protein product [Caenorhabditis angaria]|uniref:Major facilitator superfamily (MFS) profile domain-containing protein n=1 Tax=Caenorhabditis angaria TaxID=860376 RepID=A0A9P1N2J0_9PELO|nr:unnamed protein product [Caenorhabditis angaria]
MTIQVRFIVYVLSTSCITLLYALRLAFHTTILCQLHNQTSDHFLKDDEKRQYTFQSVGIGLALGLIPLHFLSSLGTKICATIFGIVGILAALVYPFAHEMGFWPSFCVRVLQGFPLVILLWLIAKVSNEWVPKNEVAMAIAFLTSVYQTAPFIAQITAAEMCQLFGWQYTYYILAGLCLLSFIAFYVIYSDDVMDNKFASLEEKEIITFGRKEISQTKEISTPYLQIFQDPTVWITWFCNISFFSSLLIFLQNMQIYMNTVMGYSIRETGHSLGFAHVLCLVAKVIFGKFMDSSKLEMTERLKRGWIILEAPAVLILLGLVIFPDARFQLIASVGFIMIHGVAIVIIVKTQAFRSAEHSHILANGNTFGVVLCIFLQPLLIKHLIKNNTFDEWSNIFLIHAILIIISIILFLFVIDSRPAKWTQISRIPTADSGRNNTQELP